LRVDAGLQPYAHHFTYQRNQICHRNPAARTGIEDFAYDLVGRGGAGAQEGVGGVSHKVEIAHGREGPDLDSRRPRGRL